MNSVAPATLDEVLRHPGIWRRSASAQQHVRALATGLPELDALLPGGGWPCGALSEILFEYDGLGELTLLMPALAELTRRQQRVVFVAPPYVPYAPALAGHGLDLRYVVQIESNANEGAWSAEQCLRSGSCGAVLGWLQQADYTQLRRLQLAAESGDALAFLFRPAHAAAKASPAALRLRLRASDEDQETSIAVATHDAANAESAMARIDSAAARSAPACFSIAANSAAASSSATAPSGPTATHADLIARIDIEILKCRGNLDRRRPTRLRWSRLSSAFP
jgi:hypothetical protein